MLEEPVAEMDKDPNQPNFKLEADFVENPKHSSEQPVNHNSGVWIKPELNIKEEPLDERDMEISEACNVGLYVREEESIAAKSKSTDIQWKGKSLRNSFRRELAIIKKEKPGSAQERLRKESVYFKQLSYLLPICKTRPHENEAVEDPTEGRNTEKESQPQDPSTHQKKRKKPLLSDEQVLFQALAKKVNTPDDPEKQFLLCLLPYFKSIPESAKLDVKVEFMNILKRYKNLPTLVNQQYFPPPHDLFPGPSSSVSYTPHNLAPDIMPSQSTASQRQKVPSSTPSPAPSATSQALSPWSDSSSICDEY